MRRLTIPAAMCALVMACGGLDQKKFDGVLKAGKALQYEVNSSGGGSTSKARDLLKEFDAEINALRDRTIGKQEVEALKSYAEAADAYRYFLRFRAMDADGGLIIVKGPNLEVASRYKLPMDTRNGATLVNRAQAITILLQAGEQHLSDANRIVSGR